MKGQSIPHHAAGATGEWGGRGDELLLLALLRLAHRLQKQPRGRENENRPAERQRDMREICE